MESKKKPKHSQSIFDKEFNLDQKTKQAFGKFIKAARKKKEATGEHSQIIICGSEEFGEKK